MALLVASALLVLAGAANALPIFVGDTQDLVNGGQGKAHQDKLVNVNWLVSEYNSASDPDLPAPLIFLGKWEVDEARWDGGKNPGFSGDFSGGSGTWSAPAGWTAPIYYSIKAGSWKSGGGFELYYANGDLSGSWSTSGLGGKKLSHISFWSAPASAPSPIPEPGTSLLFGVGLAVLAGVGRRKKG